MKIVELIPSMSDGGAETLVKDYAIMLTELGHEVCVVTRYPPANMANGTLMRERGIRIWPIFPAVNRINQVKKHFFSKWVIPARLKKLVREFQPDVLHVHMDMLTFVKPIAKELKGVRLFYTCHSLPVNFFSGARQSEFEAAKYLIAQNDLRLIGLHKDMAEELDRMFSVENTVVLRNGVDFCRFRSVEESRSDIRASLNIPENAFVAGHIGRFSKEKNHLFLVDVFEQLARRQPDAFLLLVGSGGLMGAVRERLAQKGLDGRYLILEHRTDVPRLLKAMDVFVFPSVFEGLSVTMVEAQAAGLRCVVSDRVNPESVLSDRTVLMDIEAPAEQWAEAVLDTERKNEIHGDLSVFDMNRVIRTVERLYAGETDI